MCKKLIYPFSFVLLLSLVCNAWGQAGTGLRAEYFHWSGSSPPSRADAFRDLIFTRIEPQVNCYWNPGVSPPPSPQLPPPTGVRTDTFSVRWTGELVAPTSEAYTFITGSDDGVRLYFNGVLIIDNWTDHDRAEDTSDPVQLVAGQRYPIVLEGYENGGEAEWQLYWRSQSTARQLVPQSVLYPTVKPKDFLASKPIPADGAVIKETWVNMGWTAGEAAVSHDVYIGDNFDDVDAGIEDTFRGNQATTNFIVGFPGFPYPDGLTIGTTYYWRIDELEADGTVHKGNVWSFTVAPKNAFNPKPPDGAGSVATDARLSWEPGFGAKLHYVYFGDKFDDVNNATGAPPSGLAAYAPGTLKAEKVYYWRVDEFDVVNTYKGDVWSFSTLGAVGSPTPSHGAKDVKHTQILKWSAGDNAASHQVYFGTDKDAVRNANTGSPEYKGTRDLGSESYDPGKLEWETTYYWRIDEVNNVNPNSPWVGSVWTFTTGRFIVVEDFESYNDIDPPAAGSNRIFEAWPDGYATPTTNGALVGNELPPYAERSIVHSGVQSMPYIYNNSVAKNSQAAHTLEYPRDWTEKNVNTLSLWFRGEIFNSPEQMYVVLNGSAVVYHDNPDAVMTIDWTQWKIDLQEFANQGINLADVNMIGIGFGNRSSPQVGGSGTIYFDDIRLYPPPPEPAQ